MGLSRNRGPRGHGDKEWIMTSEGLVFRAYWGIILRKIQLGVGDWVRGLFLGPAHRIPCGGHPNNAEKTCISLARTSRSLPMSLRGQW